MKSTVADLIKDIPVPPLARVFQTFPDDHIADVGQAVARALDVSGLAGRLPRGREVAIAVGSRGIARLPEIVRATVAWFQGQGASPFLAPAMGSHGGATAQGQLHVLAELGVTEASAGCPIHSSMEVVEAGILPGGQPVYLDRHAANARGIFVINRVKPHTAFRAKHESGLVKMLVIGLGKQRGADSCHSLGFGVFPGVMVEMARLILDRWPVLGGLAVVENAYDRPCRVEATTAENLLECDARLLEEARGRMPSLPARNLDVLIVDEMGKNISGAGLDGAITGRFATPYAASDMRVAKLAVLDLTPESDGNAVGMGNADIITRRLFAKIDFSHVYANAITTTLFKSGFLPMVLDSDLQALRCAIQTCNAGQRPPRIMRVRNTLHVSQLMVSPALVPELREHPACTVLDPAEPLPFGPDGALQDLGRWSEFTGRG